MKRALFLTAFIVILALLWAFEGFIPASEMSGSYFKMSTYYQKTYDNFEDGFDDMGLMLSTPLLYRNFSLEADFTSWGDDVWKDMQFNLSPGYQVNSWLTAAVSGGFFRRSLDQGGLNFGEAETLDSEEASTLTVGASLHGSFVQNRLKVGVGLYNLNQPDVSQTAAGDETLPMKILADVDSKVSPNIKLGGYYHHEDDEDYIGARIGVSIPNDFFTANVWSTSEKLTVAPEFNTLNYWDVMFAYDYDYEQDLSSDFNNYGVYVSYQLPPATSPDITFTDDRFAQGYFETLDESVPLQFKVSGPERYEYVSANLNGKQVLRETNMRDYRGQPFRADLKLNPGRNTLAVEAQGVRGEPTQHSVNIVRLEREITLDFMPQTVDKGERYDVVWLAPLDDAEYQLSLMEDGNERVITPQPIDKWEAREGLVKSYRYNWQANEVENDIQYRLRVTDRTSGIYAESTPFTGVAPVAVVAPDTTGQAAAEAARRAAEAARRRQAALERAREEERQRRVLEVGSVPEVITNEDNVSITWMSKVKDGAFHVWLYQGDQSVRELTAAPVAQSQSAEGWEQHYAFAWKADGLVKDATYNFRVMEERTGLEANTNTFRGDVLPPPVEEAPAPQPKPFPWGLVMGVAIGVVVLLFIIVAARRRKK